MKVGLDFIYLFIHSKSRCRQLKDAAAAAAGLFCLKTARCVLYFEQRRNWLW